MQAYETIFIASVELPTQRLEDLIEKVKTIITKAEGEIVTLEKWGRRRLAYPIRRHREGFYVYIKFKAPGAILAELSRFFLVSDEVIRQLTCKAVRTRGLAPAGAAVPASALADTPVTPEIPAVPAAPAPTPAAGGVQ